MIKVIVSDIMYKWYIVLYSGVALFFLGTFIEIIWSVNTRGFVLFSIAVTAFGVLAALVQFAVLMMRRKKSNV